MTTTRFDRPVLVTIPAYGSPHLTDAVLGDLLDQGFGDVPQARVVVVDNAGDYTPARTSERVSVVRPGANLRWIGAANWSLRTALAAGDAVCVVLNNDTRLSPHFLVSLVRPCEDPDVALAAACYDDFWLHQRARTVPATAADYLPVPGYREVPFCDGTALAFSVPAIGRLGLLDQVAFPRHGYGADLDLSLRARTAGYRCVVTEECYVSHLRRATMELDPQNSAERNRHEILTGMLGLWGPDWRARVGLGPGAFPPHNTGSGASWYL
ncbi:MAG: hypothetical protein JWP61_1650 [Friedmanniella sp.]|nr:hypothetical protein [Friedmanniella sp.]